MKELYDEIHNHYETHNEDDRFETRWCRVEYQTTLHYIHKYLKPGHKILEIGASTGQYTIALAKEGYELTAVELVEHNLDILKSKLTEDMAVNPIVGNALDLGILPDETYDITLLLGPMYHLLAEEHKRQALREALRVTKSNGIVFVAYCVTDGPMINYIFRLGKYHEMVQRRILDKETLCIHTENGFLFDHMRKTDIDKLISEFNVERLHYVATDGLASFLQSEMEEMDEETLEALYRYHLTVCEQADLLGATAHSLDILRKKPALETILNHTGTKTIETERLILRRFTIEDAEVMFCNWASDDEVTKYLSWPTHKSVDVTKLVVTHWINNYHQKDYYLWAIALKETNEPIGSISVNEHSDKIHKVMVGYCIGRNWWHQGITSEALQAVIKYLFLEVGVNRIEARHNPNNPNSGAVMSKCGMVYEGTLRQSNKDAQGIGDACYYSILKEEYMAKTNKKV